MKSARRIQWWMTGYVLFATIFARYSMHVIMVNQHLIWMNTTHPHVVNNRRLFQSRTVNIPVLHGAGNALLDKFSELKQTKCNFNSSYALPRLGSGREEGTTRSMDGFTFHHYQCRGEKGKDFDGNFATTMDFQFRYLLPSFLSSFMSHNKGRYRFLALTVGLDHALMMAMCDHFNILYPRLSIEFYSFGANVLEEAFAYQNEELHHVPIVTMARLLMPLMVSPESVSKVLYLDLDGVVTNNFHDLFNGKVCSDKQAMCAKLSIRNTAVWIPEKQRCLLEAFDGDFKMFNAGVMYMDMAQMRSWGLPSFAVHVSRTLHFNDQTILNFYGSFQTSFGALDPTYNIYFRQDDKDHSLDTIRFFHSAGSIKAWNTKNTWSGLWKKHMVGNFIYVWPSFTQEIPPSGILALKTASSNLFGFPVLCFCMTRRCRDQLLELSLPNVHPVQLRLKDLIEMKTPLSHWFRNVGIYKIWSGSMFPEYLKLAVELAVLYVNGGLLSSWRLKQISPLKDLNFGSGWCQEINEDEQSRSSARLLYFPAEDAQLKAVLLDFYHFFKKFEYQKGEPLLLPARWTSWDACDLFRVGEKQRDDERHTLPSNEKIKSSYEMVKTEPALSSHDMHYGQMWYDVRTTYLRDVYKNMGVNLGDEVQGLATLQWLPFVDEKIERDDLSARTKHAEVVGFLNAWYGTKTMSWPPSATIKPILISMHVEPSVRDLFSSQESIDYLKKHEPVGARDQSTLDFFQQLGIDAYLSYCMTLTLQKTLMAQRDCAKRKTCSVLIVDVDPQVVRYFPSEVSASACMASAKWVDEDGDGETLNGLARYTKAYKLLKMYASADLVITSRLHTALPCASLGIPAVLVLDKKMPGGGGSADNHQRFGGLRDLVHTVTIGEQHPSFDAFLADFPWFNPPPNPGEWRLEEIRCTMLEAILKIHPTLASSFEFFDYDEMLTPCTSLQ